MEPVIGITAGFNNSEGKHFLTDYYIQAIQSLGGIPLILPALDIKLVGRIYNLVDGLIFSGGSDVDPEYFNQPPLKGMGEITPNRDKFEIALAQKALAGHKPVLGICRGIQVLNIAAGGDIYQDLEGVTKQEHDQKAPKWYPFHNIEIDPNSLLFKLIGKTRVKVNSFHHQSVSKIGRDFKKVAWTEDGLTEAIESIEQDKIIIGVQWHPECSWDRYEYEKKLFQFLITKAEELKKQNQI